MKKLTAQALREEAISFGYLIEYDGGVLRGRVGSTKENPLHWQTRTGAERVLARATSLHDRRPRVVKVALIQLPLHFEDCSGQGRDPNGCDCEELNE